MIVILLFIIQISQTSRYIMDSTPDWMVKPPPFSPYLTKYEYDRAFAFFSKLINTYLTLKNKNMNDNYANEKTINDSDSSLNNIKILRQKIEAKKKSNNSI